MPAIAAARGRARMLAVDHGGVEPGLRRRERRIQSGVLRPDDDEIRRGRQFRGLRRGRTEHALVPVRPTESTAWLSGLVHRSQTLVPVAGSTP